MIDLHSHILPAVDDGSSCVEMSVAMLEEEARQGIACVMATPHFYAHRDEPERFLARRAEAEIRLQEAIRGRTDLPRLCLGAEVSFYSGMSESDVLQSLCLGNSNYLLVEMPMAPWPERAYHELAAMKERQGITPVLAHVERYLPRFRAERVLNKLEALPVLLQANASFFLERRTAKMAMNLLCKGKIHLLGSDCHNLDSRPPRLGPAVEKIRQTLGDDALEWIKHHQRIVCV